MKSRDRNVESHPPAVSIACMEYKQRGEWVTVVSRVAPYIPCIHRLFIIFFCCFPWAETALCAQHTLKRKQLLSTLSTDQTSLSIFFCVTCTGKKVFFSSALQSIAFVVFVFVYKVEISTENRRKTNKVRVSAKAKCLWFEVRWLCSFYSALISHSNGVFKWKTIRKRRKIRKTNQRVSKWANILLKSYCQNRCVKIRVNSAIDYYLHGVTSNSTKRKRREWHLKSYQKKAKLLL